MPARRRPVVGDGALSRFALDLRELQLQTTGKVPLAVEAGASRTAVYAALSGTRLPNEETLDAIIRAWTSWNEGQVLHWRRRRHEVEEALAMEARGRGEVKPRRTEAEAEFTARLKRLWDELALSAADVAYVGEMSPRTIHAYLAGRTIPTPTKLQQLFDAMLALVENSASEDMDYFDLEQLDVLREEYLFRAREARREERARVRELARALPAPADLNP